MDENNIINLNEYEIIKTLGKGSFGRVLLVERIETSKQYAAKETFTSINPKSREGDFFKEIFSYSKISNPAILQLFGYSYENFSQKPFPTMILDYMKNDHLIIFFTSLLNIRNYQIQENI